MTSSRVVIYKSVAILRFHQKWEGYLCIYVCPPTQGEWMSDSATLVSVAVIIRGGHVQRLKHKYGG